MLLTEFDEKKFAKSMWEEGHESGYLECGNDTVEKLVALGCDATLDPKVLEKNKLETIMLRTIPSFGDIHRNLLLCPHHFHFLDIYNFSLNKCPCFFLILDICIKFP